MYLRIPLRRVHVRVRVHVYVYVECITACPIHRLRPINP